MDIHTFIEVIGEQYIWTYAEVEVGRDYNLFRILEKFEIRGLPDDIGGLVFDKFFIYVTDAYKEQSWSNSGYVSKAKADEWFETEGAFYYGSKHEQLSKSWISSPDWWDPSWLTLSEVEEALSEYMECEYQNLGFLVLVDTMRSLEKHIGKGKSRLVFWFDV